MLPRYWHGMQAAGSMAHLRVIDGGVGSKARRDREFERLYLESYSLVYNYVRIRLGNDHDAEDVVADAYLRAARAFDQYDPSRAKFSTWVTKIAINCMNGFWRKERSVTAIDDIPEGSFAVADETEHLSDRDQVDRLLSVLTPEELELVLMKYRDGKRNVDIAEELGMNPSTVATKLFNAINKMRATQKEK